MHDLVGCAHCLTHDLRLLPQMATTATHALEAQLYKEFRVAVGDPPRLGSKLEGGNLGRRHGAGNRSSPQDPEEYGGRWDGIRANQTARSTGYPNRRGVSLKRQVQRAKRPGSATTHNRRKLRHVRRRGAKSSGQSPSVRRRQRPLSAQNTRRPRVPTTQTMGVGWGAHGIHDRSTPSEEPFARPTSAGAKRAPHVFFPTSPRFDLSRSGSALPRDALLSAHALVDPEGRDEDVQLLLTVQDAALLSRTPSGLGAQPQSCHRTAARAVIGTSPRGHSAGGGRGGGSASATAGPGAYARNDGCIGVEPQLLSYHRSMPVVGFASAKRKLAADAKQRSPGPIYFTAKASRASSASRRAPKFKFPSAARLGKGTKTAKASPGPIYNTSSASQRSTAQKHAPRFSFGTAPRFR